MECGRPAHYLVHVYFAGQRQDKLDFKGIYSAPYFFLRSYKCVGHVELDSENPGKENVWRRRFVIQVCNGNSENFKS